MAINNNAGAPIFKNCDYGIVGDVKEILPLLTAALDTGGEATGAPHGEDEAPPPPKEEPHRQALRLRRLRLRVRPRGGGMRLRRSPRAPSLKSCRRTGSVLSAARARTISSQRERRQH